ncbi:hypothetical protein PUN28_018893 [Cardiocondyla obscurior]|uniref:Uncharacterized protein n=1 Tax=Cardiocondyla obscurior TaxID=286306 RepID=A0AAW2EHX7_9HYME
MAMLQVFSRQAISFVLQKSNSYLWKCSVEARCLSEASSSSQNIGSPVERDERISKDVAYFKKRSVNHTCSPHKVDREEKIVLVFASARHVGSRSPLPRSSTPSPFPRATYLFHSI